MTRQALLPTVFLMLAAMPATVAAQDDPSKRLAGTVIHQFGEMRWRASEELLCPAYSPGGKMLACACNWRLGLCDVDAGRAIDSFGVRGCGHASSVAWALGGKLHPG